jgi:hypothetical protein
MRIAVYTCITDAYDPLYPPACVDQRLDYFCLTKNSANVVEPWKFRPIDLPYLNTKDQNRTVYVGTLFAYRVREICVLWQMVFGVYLR